MEEVYAELLIILMFVSMLSVLQSMIYQWTKLHSRVMWLHGLNIIVCSRTGVVYPNLGSEQSFNLSRSVLPLKL